MTSKRIRRYLCSAVALFLVVLNAPVARAADFQAWTLYSTTPSPAHPANTAWEGTLDVRDVALGIPMSANYRFEVYRQAAGGGYDLAHTDGGAAGGGNASFGYSLPTLIDAVDVIVVCDQAEGPGCGIVTDPDATGALTLTDLQSGGNAAINRTGAGGCDELSYDDIVCADQVWEQGATATDPENDGNDDPDDNCPDDFNPFQEDHDLDGIGTACDPFDDRDPDEDGVLPPSSDNCPDVANPGQEDADLDGHGDACDPLPNTPGVVDADGDGYTADSEPPSDDDDTDPCSPDDQTQACIDQTADDDSDGYTNATDNCPLVANPGQEDADADGTGDACDDLVLRSLSRANTATLRSTHGRTVTLFGAVASTAAACRNAQPLEVYRGTTKVKPATSSSTGAYSITLAAAPGSYRVIATESSACASAYSPTTTVQVAKKLVLRGPAKIRRGGRGTYKVNVTPGGRGDRVTIFKGTKRLTTVTANSLGIATFKVRITRRSVLRAKSAAADGYLGGISNKITTRV